MKIIARNMRDWEVFLKDSTLSLKVKKLENEKNRFQITFEYGNKVVNIKTYNLDRCIQNIEALVATL